MAGIKEVAKYAGVSVGTVSNVINGNPSVKQLSREKVEEAIKALNYIPNEVARNFKMQKSKMVALLLPSINNPFFSELAYYIEDELDRFGYKLILCNSGGKPDKELYYLDMLTQNKVAGIVGITYNNVFKNTKNTIPVISIDRHLTETTICVTSDNVLGGMMAANHLVEKGCKKIAFIGSYSLVETETMNRKKGFVEQAKALGVDYVLFEDEDPILDIKLFCDDFISKHRDVDGVFAITDIVAAAYIEQGLKKGICVPRDVKVIGYDGIQKNEFFHPILSTIRQPVEEMARTSIKLLIAKIEGKNVISSTYRIPVKLIQGETT